MTEQSEQTTNTKRKAGSIRQYATLGRSKTSEHSDVETLKRSDAPTLESPDTQEATHTNAKDPEPPELETSKRQSVQEPERSSVKTPKRERHTIYLPPDLSEWVKIRAIKTKSEISEVVTEAVQRLRSEVE